MKKKETVFEISSYDEIGCLGDFDATDVLCSTRCALRLRCAIESEENARLELIEDLMEGDSLLMKIQ